MIPDHYPRIAAEAATQIANAPAGKWRDRAAMGLSVEQIIALGLFAAPLLEETPREAVAAANRPEGIGNG